MVHPGGDVKGSADGDRERVVEHVAGNDGGRANTQRRSVTLKDVADHVGVSKALASMVFRGVSGPSEQTRSRVLAAADELGYRPNRAAALLSSRRTHLIGVMGNVRNSFHAELVEYLVAAADAAGYEIVLGAVTPTHGEARAVETLLDFRSEALILLGPEFDAAVLADLGAKVPVVAVGRRVNAVGIDVVRAADGRGIAQLVDHFADLGHRRISHLTGGPGTISADRRSGYMRAMRRHGLDDEIDILDGDYTESGGIAAAAALLNRTVRPTAVIAVNDRSAVGLLDSLRRSGLDVPGDIAVAGYDDSPLARLSHVELTTVDQQPHEQAARAVQAVVERLDHARTEPVNIVIPPRLVPRATSGNGPLAAVRADTARSK